MATTVDIFAAWQPWQVALAETVALEMLRHDIGPEQMRDLARQYMRTNAAAAANEAAHRAAAKPGAAPYRSPRANRFRPGPRRLPRPDWQREEERGVMLGGACPRCGGPLVIKRMCPRVSPRIRTQLACNNDACDWMAVSEHPWEYLARNGLAGNVEEQ